MSGVRVLGLASVSMPNIAVVIALYNGGATIVEQLDALAAQTVKDFEVVVADNGSTDDGAHLVRSHQLNATLVAARERRGQAHARNIGAAHTTASKLLFCDQDDVADREWVAAMSEALDRWHLVGGRSEGATLNGPVAAWRTEPMTPTQRLPLPAATGSNMGIRRAVFDAVGGWPEDYLGGGEDFALCWRAQFDGFTIGYAPDAVMHYRYRQDLRSHARQQYQYGRQMGRLRLRFPALDHPPLVPLWRSAAWLAVHGSLLLHRRTVGLWVGVAAQAVGAQVGIRSPSSSSS